MRKVFRWIIGALLWTDDNINHNIIEEFVSRLPDNIITDFLEDLCYNYCQFVGNTYFDNFEEEFEKVENTQNSERN